MDTQRSRAYARVPALLLAVLAVPLFLGSCGSGDLPLDEVDPAAVPAHPTYDQVFAILHNECAPCHGGEDEDEDEGNDDNDGYAVIKPGARLQRAADAEPDLGDCISIVAKRDDILEQIEGNTMPPGAWPRLTSEQKLLIRRWIENGAPAPCN